MPVTACSLAFWRRAHSWADRRLVQHSQLRRLVLQHPLLGLDACLKLQDPLLIGRGRDGVDQLLDGGKAGARRRVGVLRGHLKERGIPARGDELRLLGGRERGNLRGREHRIRADLTLDGAGETTRDLTKARRQIVAVEASEEVLHPPGAGRRLKLLLRLSELLLSVRELLLKEAHLLNELDDRAHIDDRELRLGRLHQPHQRDEPQPGDDGNAAIHTFSSHFTFEDR